MELGQRSFKDKATDFFYSKWFKLIWGVIFIIGLPFVYQNYKITGATLHAISTGMCIIGGIYCIFSFLKMRSEEKNNPEDKVFN
jgi:hypothetical protein